MFQQGWSVQSTAKKRYMPIYKDVIKEKLCILDEGYFPPMTEVQCSNIHPSSAQQHTDAPELLREGCMGLPDDFPKVRINNGFPSINDYGLWADPASTPSSLPHEKHLCHAMLGQQIPALSLSPQELLHFQYCLL